MRVLPLPPITTRVPRRAFAPPGGTGDGDEAPDFCVIFKSVYSCPNPQQSSGGRVGQGVMINYIDMTCLPSLQDELVVDRSASIQVRPSLEALKREAADLESQIRQLQVGTQSFKLFLLLLLYCCWRFLLCLSSYKRVETNGN